jgi:hypothetical protein
MFCQQCGVSLAEGASACPSCSTPLSRGAPAPVARMASTVKAAYGNAFAALKSFAGDPVGRLPQTYAALGESQALRIGITYGVVSMLCFLLGGYLLFPFKENLFEHLGVSGVLRGIVFSALPFACAVAGSLATRKVFGGAGGGKGGDCFVAGAALLPAALGLVVNGILGLGHTGMATAITVFAGCTGVLMLFSGYRGVARLSDRAATLAVPIVVVLSLWVGKSMASSVIESAVARSVGSESSESGWNLNLGFSNER